MPLIIKTFSPTGGVMSPISTTFSASSPNLMGLSSAPFHLKSTPITMGKKMGMVSKIMDKLSMMQPNTR